jgi:hypothetical protein
MDAVNGLWWRGGNSGEKLGFVLGFNDGMSVVGSTGIAGTLPVCPTYVKDWVGTHKYTAGDVVREIDLFYESPINLPLPVMIGAVYAHMRLTGATQNQLDTYRTRMLEAIAQPGKK